MVVTGFFVLCYILEAEVRCGKYTVKNAVNAWQQLLVSQIPHYVAVPYCNHLLEEVKGYSGQMHWALRLHSTDVVSQLHHAAV